MPAPKKYRHQAQLDSLYANQGITAKAFPEELQDEIKEWNRAWVEKGKPNENKELTIWSKEISVEIDEHLSQFDVSLDEEEEVATILAPVVVTPVETAPVVTEPVVVAPVAPQEVVPQINQDLQKPAATKAPRQKLSERMPTLEKALETLYNTGKIEYSKAELIQAGFNPGFFGWTSTGWHNGKFFDVKKSKKSTVYTIVKI